jgi:hypothetical protein
MKRALVGVAVALAFSLGLAACVPPPALSRPQKKHLKKAVHEATEAGLGER